MNSQIDPELDVDLIIKKLLETDIESRKNFYQTVLLLTSGVFGIVISLHTETISIPLHKILFLVSLTLLLLVCFLSAAVLYDLSMIHIRTTSAVNSHKHRGPSGIRMKVGVPVPEWNLVCQKIVLFLLPVSLTILGLYSILSLW